VNFVRGSENKGSHITDGKKGVKIACFFNSLLKSF